MLSTDKQEITVTASSAGVMISGLDKARPVKIPSQLYPLTGETQFIYNKNTSPLPPAIEKTVREVFDSIQPGIGMCYENTNRLIAALKETGITATPYVGWVILSDADKPIHHCFAAIDGSVLDFLIKPSLVYTDKDLCAAQDIHQAREILTNKIIKLKNTPNSQKAIFGQVDERMFYIASHCSPDAGRKRFQKLLRAYPKHPSYTNIYSNGSNALQTMLAERLNATNPMPNK